MVDELQLCERLAYRAAAGAAKVWVHPSEARRRGLSEGQPVTLRNHVGLTVQLALSDTVPEDVALLPKGAGPRWMARTLTSTC